MKIIDKILDWWRRRRPPPISNPPVQDILRIDQAALDEYDLHMLVQREWDAVIPNLKQQWKPLLKELYIRLGGNFDNAKAIFCGAANAWLQKRLESTDLPGPVDDYLRVKIIEVSTPMVEKAFDEFFVEPGK